MSVSRRAFVQAAALAPLGMMRATRLEARAQGTANPDFVYGATTIPRGIRSRTLQGINGTSMHVLEAGFEPANRLAPPAVGGP